VPPPGLPMGVPLPGRHSLVGRFRNI
jgi:hypothetical protein